MAHVIDILKTDMLLQRAYFKESESEIADRNLSFMRIICYAGTAIYVLFAVITAAFFPQMSISFVYSIPVLAIVLFMLELDRRHHHNRLNAHAVMKSATIMDVMILAFVVIMSVFPHPDTPAVYFPLFLMLAPVVFILPSYQHVIINSAAAVVFFVLVFNFKMPEVWPHELFEAFTAWVFSMLVVFMVARFRVQGETLKNRYYQMSQFDALTGAMNKGPGKKAIESAIEQGKPTESAALMMIDIDDFKGINDTLGHAEGDSVLREFGALVVAQCRAGDVVMRFGGDEFAVLLNRVGTCASARAVAQRILQATKGMHVGHGVQITCSVGVCFDTYENLALADAFEQADAALYRSKAEGKAQVSAQDTEGRRV